MILVGGLCYKREAILRGCGVVRSSPVMSNLAVKMRDFFRKTNKESDATQSLVLDDLKESFLLYDVGTKCLR
jgi:hypothetical protein